MNLTTFLLSCYNESEKVKLFHKFVIYMLLSKSLKNDAEMGNEFERKASITMKKTSGIPMKFQ